jgi:hypothetical protein
MGRPGKKVKARPIHDPKHWRDRTAEMRALAATMKEVEAQAIMVRLADDYDRLAEHAAKHLGTDPG